MKNFSQLTLSERALVGRINHGIRQLRASVSGRKIYGDNIELSIEDIIRIVGDLNVPIEVNTGIPAERPNRNPKIKRKEQYSMADVFRFVGRFGVIFDGDSIDLVTRRYILFRIKNVCAHCGLIGQYFVKEQIEGTNRYHLNLYGVRDGKEILLTCDHKIARGIGGKNYQNNYQTLCYDCNQRKSEYERELWKESAKKERDLRSSLLKK